MGNTRQSILETRGSSFMARAKRISAAAFLGATASLMADLLLLDREHLHAILPYADTPGFWSVFGLFWCGLLILGSKWIGHRFLMRAQDPYNRPWPQVTDHERASQ